MTDGTDGTDKIELRACFTSPITQLDSAPRTVIDITRATVKYRRARTYRFKPLSVKNVAPLPMWRTGGCSMQPCSTDVRSYRLDVSNLVPPEERTAKWRFGPSKKRHLPPFSTTFSTIFPGFFQRTCLRWHFGANSAPKSTGASPNWRHGSEAHAMRAPYGVPVVE